MADIRLIPLDHVTYGFHHGCYLLLSMSCRGVRILFLQVSTMRPFMIILSKLLSFYISVTWVQRGCQDVRYTAKHLSKYLTSLNDASMHEHLFQYHVNPLHECHMGVT